MKNVFIPKTILAPAILCFILLVGGCKKENPVLNNIDNSKLNASRSATNSGSPQNQNSAMIFQNASLSSSYYVGGTFGGHALLLAGNPSPFSDSIPPHATGMHSAHNTPNHFHYDTDDDDSTTYFITGANWNGNTSEGLAVSSGTIELGLAVRVYIAPITGHATKYLMLQPGTQSFYNTENEVHSGVLVTFTDAHGVLWTSNGDQTGSTFTITSRGADAGSSTTFSGTFSAKMYDPTGNMKLVTNGTFNAVAGL